MCQCCPHHIETSQLMWTANQLTDFYMRATLALNGLLNKEETKYPIRKLTIVAIIFFTLRKEDLWWKSIFQIILYEALKISNKW